MRHFLLLTLSILVLQISAQEYSFKLFTNKEGVQGVELLAITQDGKGFLWTGGAFGFNRFDGFVFENFNEANGLANNTVYGINEDSKGKIWVSTTNGISCFNGKNFKNYLQSSTNPQIFFNTIETSKHGLIAYGVGGIYKFTNDSFIRILPELNNVRAIVTNKKGDLFIGTKSGLYLYDGKTLQNQSINEHLVSKSITCLCFDKDQNLWMGTTKGIACALEDGSVKTYYTEQLASNIIRDVKFNDNYGVIFLSDGGDVKIFKNGVFKEISLRPLLSAGNGTRLVVDKESVIWISSTGGLIKMTKNAFIKSDLNEKINVPVFGMTYDKADNLYFATTNGLYRNNKNGTEQFNIDKIPDNNMLIAVAKTDSCLFVGSYSGQVFKFNKDKFTPFGNIDLVSSNPAYHILTAVPNELWISKSQNVVHFNNTNFSVNYLARNPESITRSAIKDSKGRIWFANYTNLCYYENGKIKTLGKQEGFGFSNITTIVEDKFGSIWVGTFGYGIVKYDGEKFTQYSEKQGLVNNFLSSSLYDSETNALWVATIAGVSKIRLNEKGEVKTIKNYDAEQGLSNNECNENAIIKLKNGNILIGTANGLFEYKNNEKSTNKKQSPSLQLKSIKLFYESFDFSPFSDSISNFNGVGYNLILPHDKNNLTFDFIGLSLNEPQKVNYKWKLIGADKEYCPETNKSNCTYSNLAPNDYTLSIIACGINGVWSSPLIYTFTIKPAFYNTWWFYLLSITLLIIITYLLYRWRIATIKQQQNEKITQLKKIATAELTAIRSQLNPHFMFNVLSAIQDVYLDKDEEKAQLFIADFASLMRSLLNNSTKKEVTLNEEISFIKKYIGLEQIRLGDKFKYNITVADNIDTEDVLIPPMLLQPFIENAINHGLLHKTENGNLTISFSKKENNLYIIIADDGIGRQASALIKKLNHSSMAISLITERLDILNTIEDKLKYTCTITDLINENNQAIGTQVEFILPII